MKGLKKLRQMKRFWLVEQSKYHMEKTLRNTKHIDNKFQNLNACQISPQHHTSIKCVVVVPLMLKLNFGE